MDSTLEPRACDSLQRWTFSQRSSSSGASSYGRGRRVDGGSSLKSVTEFLGKVAIRHAIIVCADAEKHCPSLRIFCGDVQSSPFDDPAACTGSVDERLDEFRRVRDEIRSRIYDWLAADT